MYQFVSFLRGGQPVKMSKRAGTFVSLDELIDEVGTDAARFHLLLFSNDRPMNFDIEKWRGSRSTIPSTTSSTDTHGSRRSCGRRRTEGDRAPAGRRMPI